MKTLAILFAFLFVVAANAQTFNPTVTAQASFDCMVIAPITVSQPTAVTLPDVIAGQVRDIANVDVTFNLTGQGGYTIAVNTVGSTYTDNGCALVGGWGTVPTIFDAGGAASYTFTIDKIDATATTVTGTRNYVLKVNASYSGL